MNIAEKIIKMPEHTTYAHTFLHWIILQIRYSYDPGNHYASYKRFFDAFPGLEFTESKYESMKTVPVRIKASSGGASLKLDNDFIQIKIRGDYYKNFDTTIRPFLQSLSSLMNDLKASLSKIEIRKINLWGYKIDEGDFTKKVMDAVLSSDLNEYWSPEEKNVEDDEEIELTRLFGEETLMDQPVSYVIAFGYIRPVKDTTKIARVVLDLQAESVLSLSSSQLIESFNALNNRLYDIFHWGISTKSIDILKHE